MTTETQKNQRHAECTLPSIKRTLRWAQQLQRSTLRNQNMNRPRNTRFATRRPFQTTHRNTFATRLATHGSALGAHSFARCHNLKSVDKPHRPSKITTFIANILKHTKVNLIIESSKLTLKQTDTRKELITTSAAMPPNGCSCCCHWHRPSLPTLHGAWKEHDLNSTTKQSKY